MVPVLPQKGPRRPSPWPGSPRRGPSPLRFGPAAQGDALMALAQLSMQDPESNCDVTLIAHVGR